MTPSNIAPEVTHLHHRKSLLGAGITLPLALILLTLIVSLTVLGPSFLSSPSELNISLALQPPSALAWAGTDELGRDVLSRIATGLRFSIAMAVTGTLIGAAFGTCVGLLSSFFGGAWDRILMRFVDIQIAVPQVLLILVIVTVLGPNFWTISFALALSCWIIFARVARAEVLSLREQDMVAGMIASGMSRTRLLVRHVLPNISGPLLALLSLEVAHLILAEASLGYLGLGLPPPTPTLGRMVSEGQVGLMGGVWWPSLLPGLVITLLIFSINIVGDWLQKRLDPRQRMRADA